MNNTTRYDIVGLGCAAVDDLLYVPIYPPPDSKVQICRIERQGGGLTATALVAAAKLGAKCAYAGVLGDDELSEFLKQRLTRDGVDVSHVGYRPCSRPIHSFIIVDESTQARNIFYDLEGVYGAEPGWPDEAIIRSAGALYVDHFGVEGMCWAARIARSAGVPVVADLERGEMPGFPDLLALVNHLIVSRAFAEKLTGTAHPMVAAIQLWRPDRQCVVGTAGEAACWYTTDGKGVRHQPAFAVQAVDTTGCGDVFHGAYAAALVHGISLREIVRFASAVAAIKATRRGGQDGAPQLHEVEEFLRNATGTGE